MTAPTMAQVVAYNNALQYAESQNTGPVVAGLTVPAIPGTNYVGNGANDLANRAYATAIAEGLTPNSTVNGVTVGSFLTTTGPTVAIAEDQVVQSYLQGINYDASIDSFGDLPRGTLDSLAYTHDFASIYAGGNASQLVAANTNFANGAFALYLIDGNPLDLDAALFIGIGANAYQGIPGLGGAVQDALQGAIDDAVNNGASYMQNLFNSGGLSLPSGMTISEVTSDPTGFDAALASNEAASASYQDNYTGAAVASLACDVSSSTSSVTTSDGNGTLSTTTVSDDGTVSVTALNADGSITIDTASADGTVAFGYIDATSPDQQYTPAEYNTGNPGDYVDGTGADSSGLS